MSASITETIEAKDKTLQGEPAQNEPAQNEPVQAAPATDEQPQEPVPMDIIGQGTCPSLTGRSTLSFAIVRHTEDATLHLAITGNSGGGMWCKEWTPASAIQDIVLGEGQLRSTNFHDLHPGKSINTGGFILAVLRALGLVRPSADNSRIHEHVPGTTFEKVASAYFDKAATEQPAGRKTLRLKAKS